MKPLLTTITPYWGRPEQLERWTVAIKASAIPEVRNALYKIKGNIGEIHNLGAKECGTEWMMKLDVDCLTNTEFFRELIPVLQSAKPREWFNCGMLMLDKADSERYCNTAYLPHDDGKYRKILQVLLEKGGIKAVTPVSTQFICRTDDYLRLGGCLPAFKGWGWEDYQQIYMLEKFQQGRDPLAGETVTLQNVTRLCRDLISRPKAIQLTQKSPFLALFHHWHPPAEKNQRQVDRNRIILYDYIVRQRK